MALTILEALSAEKPCGNRAKNKSLSAMIGLIQHHMAEIEEARSRGYSWKQIDAVCRELWEADEKGSQLVWWKSGDMVMSCYHAIRTGSSVHGKSKQPPKPVKFSVEVTKG